jgi:tetratricopeptide (TPR) repeat protein
LEADVLLIICKLLRDRIERAPTQALEKASELHELVTKSAFDVGLFDERDYVLGELALIASKAARLIGRFREAERWLDNSDAAFRHTVDAASSLASVAFERLAVRFTSGRLDEILDLLPSVARTFERLGLTVELDKCKYLEAMTLKELGEQESSVSALMELSRRPTVRANTSLYGQVLIHLADYHVSAGNFERAAETYEKALPLVIAGDRPAAVGELKWAIGDAYRAQSAFSRALEAYRSASAEYQTLGFKGFVAKLHLVTADVLLSMQRGREAEWEILAALPVIEEEKMVPEGFAALALLRESVSRRQTDRNALRALRERILSKA